MKQPISAIETNITDSLTGFYYVEVWPAHGHCWRTVSRHRFRADGEAVCQRLEAGANKAEILALIALQNQTGLSEYEGTYLAN